MKHWIHCCLIEKSESLLSVNYCYVSVRGPGVCRHYLCCMGNCNIFVIFLIYLFSVSLVTRSYYSKSVVSLCVHYGQIMVVRGHFERVSSFLLSCGSLGGWHSVHRDWLQLPLLSDSICCSLWFGGRNLRILRQSWKKNQE